MDLDLKPEDVDRYAQFAKQHPMLTAVGISFLLMLVFLAVVLLLIGTICSYLDDTKFEGRAGAAIRIGRTMGNVVRGSGRDWAILITGHDRVLPPPTALLGEQQRVEIPRTQERTNAVGACLFACIAPA